jgi:hypothetical protein
MHKPFDVVSPKPQQMSLVLKNVPRCDQRAGGVGEARFSRLTAIVSLLCVEVLQQHEKTRLVSLGKLNRSKLRFHAARFSAGLISKNWRIESDPSSYSLKRRPLHPQSQK